MDFPAPRKAIHVNDAAESRYEVDAFSVPEHYAQDLEYIMLPHGLVLSRTERIAADIHHDYIAGGKGKVHLLCVLKGGSQFFTDLVACLRKLCARGCPSTPFTFDFVRCKSYKGTESSGDVQISLEGGADPSTFAGQHVLLIEDIIDTGTTMSKLVPYMAKLGTASVRVATLLQKRTPRSCGFVGDYVGFSIPDAFVVGYCLDYNEVFRDMARRPRRTRDRPPPRWLHAATDARRNTLASSTRAASSATRHELARRANVAASACCLAAARASWIRPGDEAPPSCPKHCSLASYGMASERARALLVHGVPHM